MSKKTKPTKKVDTEIAQLAAALIGTAKQSTGEMEQFYTSEEKVERHINIDQKLKLTVQPKKKPHKKITAHPMQFEDDPTELTEEEIAEMEEFGADEDEVEVAAPAPAPINVHALVASGSFWKTHIEPLNWCDADESVRTPAMVMNSLPNDKTRKEVRAIIDHLSGALRTGLNEEKDFTALSEADQNNLIAHIIAKRKEFYESVLACPSLALYLIDGPAKKHKYQRLLNML